VLNESFEGKKHSMCSRDAVNEGGGGEDEEQEERNPRVRWALQETQASRIISCLSIVRSCSKLESYSIQDSSQLVSGNSMEPRKRFDSLNPHYRRSVSCSGILRACIASAAQLGSLIKLIEYCNLKAIANCNLQFEFLY
jgi:hypothetical protein